MGEAVDAVGIHAQIAAFKEQKNTKSKRNRLAHIRKRQQAGLAEEVGTGSIATGPAEPQPRLQLQTALLSSRLGAERSALKALQGQCKTLEHNGFATDLLRREIPRQQLTVRAVEYALEDLKPAATSDGTFF